MTLGTEVIWQGGRGGNFLVNLQISGSGGDKFPGLRPPPKQNYQKITSANTSANASKLLKIYFRYFCLDPVLFRRVRGAKSEQGELLRLCLRAPGRRDPSSFAAPKHIPPIKSKKRNWRRLGNCFVFGVILG